MTTPGRPAGHQPTGHLPTGHLPEGGSADVVNSRPTVTIRVRSHGNAPIRVRSSESGANVQ